MLSREDAGAERIFQNNGVALLLNMIETGKAEMILAAVRTLSGMCTGHKARVSSNTGKNNNNNNLENFSEHILENELNFALVHMNYLYIIFPHFPLLK